METPTFLYKPNFCAECGEKIERESWHFWTSRRFCDNCEPVFRYQRLIPAGLAGIALLFGGIILGQMGQGTRKTAALTPEPRAFAEKPQTQPSKQINVTNQADIPANSVPREILPKNAPPANIARPAQETRVSTAPEVVYTCGARTQKGTPCSRRVKAAGMRCWQHAGKTSMLENLK